MIRVEKRQRKHKCNFDWKNGHTIHKRLTRSFDSLEQANKFAEGKQVIDIYVCDGRYKVEWLKTTDNN